MNKNIPYLIIYMIFLVVFNTLFFLFKANCSYVSVWISYGFIHLAYAAVIITQFLDKQHEEVSLKLSSYLISISYFIVELFTGIVFIAVNSTEYKFALSLQLVWLGVYLVLLITNLISNKKITNSLECTEKDRNYVKGVNAIINSILTNKYESSVVSKLNILYDIVHSSQIRTNADAMKVEAEIENRILALERNILVMSIPEQITEIEQLIDLANKRNLLTKYDRN